jgi:hypothetical protein
LVSVGVVSVGEVLRTTDTVPVLKATPVPPLATARVPARVTAPDVAEAGVRPVVPPAKVDTLIVEALLAKSLTVPALFLKYSFSSAVLMLSASSPATRFPAKGSVDDVVL